MKTRELNAPHYDGFAGAENFECGANPILGEGHDFVLVADKNGIQIYFGEGEEFVAFDTEGLRKDHAEAIIGLISVETTKEEAANWDGWTEGTC